MHVPVAPVDSALLLLFLHRNSQEGMTAQRQGWSAAMLTGQAAISGGQSYHPYLGRACTKSPKILSRMRLSLQCSARTTWLRQPC